MNYSLPLAMLGLLLISTGVLAAGDPAHGKQLHDAQCTACHTQLMGGDPTAIFTRPKSIIYSLEGLKKRVQFCETMNGAQWSESDVDDAVAYLNKEFYKFK